MYKGRIHGHSHAWAMGVPGVTKVRRMIGWRTWLMALPMLIMEITEMLAVLITAFSRVMKIQMIKFMTGEG